MTFTSHGHMHASVHQGKPPSLARGSASVILAIYYPAITKSVKAPVARLIREEYCSTVCKTASIDIYRYKHKAQERSTSQKPAFFREYSRKIWNYSYTNLQVQGCSVKGDITYCKIARSQSRPEAKLSLKTRQMRPGLGRSAD